MNFSFRNNIWKGAENQRSIVIPKNSRPFTNLDSNDNNNLGRTVGKANPIKHWRKQLYPYYQTKSSKQISIDSFNDPATSVTQDYNVDATEECSKNAALLTENINILAEYNGIKITPNTDDSQTSIKCIGGTNHITRAASTNIKSNYYTNHKSYLDAKCKSYYANSNLGEKIDDNTYNSSKCSSTHMKCNKPIVYKPSNQVFKEQGAVSASTNILRKKNNAITNNSASLKSAYGKTVVAKSTTNTGYHIIFKKGNLNNNNDCKQVFQDYPCS
uniref:Uncharacterized protein n=1 Tax=Florenciella sp. virus SA2 TaxID=3240092 RepID=A0AB39JBV1_9VIRU